MSEKTEKATSHQLKKAKEKGQVSKSVELSSALFLLFMLLLGSLLWPSIFKELQHWAIRFFMFNDRFSYSLESICQLKNMIILSGIQLWLPFALGGIVVVALSTLVQTGPVFSFFPLIPDLKRLSVVRGIKRLLTYRSLLEVIKLLLKLSITGLLLWFSLKHELSRYLALIVNTPTEGLSLGMHSLFTILLQLSFLFLALSFLDKAYTRWKYAVEHRMSKQEIKDEYRQREGDPKIKLKIKQLHQLQRLKLSAFASIKTADVVITNPTHIVVVLKYERGIMPAPKVIFKGMGTTVQQVKQIAARYHIPIIENKALARMLYWHSEVNQWVKREHFSIVAPIFRDIYCQKERP